MTLSPMQILNMDLKQKKDILVLFILAVKNI
jgi:hypothetical protein